MGTLALCLIVGTSLGSESALPAPVTLKTIAGTWHRSTGDHEVEFLFKGSTLVVTLRRGGDELVLDCDIATTRNGRVIGAIGSIKESGFKAGGGADDVFSFKVQTKGDSLDISDLRGSNVHEAAKSLVEGEFKKK